ncbi:hypothetical protein AB9F34_35155, partial [Rhizobium leguminosarum]|uniref:hypothetical protein n=1 Tax=Rhizobium leguminosarum TaxID=384 RepID=UPI003F9EAD9B
CFQNAVLRPVEMLREGADCVCAKNWASSGAALCETRGTVDARLSKLGALKPLPVRPRGFFRSVLDSALSIGST